MFYKILFLIAVAQLCVARNIHHELPDLRIIGGKEAAPHSAPYIVYFEVNPHDGKKGSIQSCGGSLLTTKHVLTAAHCVEKPNTINFLAVGVHNLVKKETTVQRLASEKVVLHKSYNDDTYENDIAIIKLKTPVTLNKNVKLVTLPTAKDVNKTYVGEKATAYGWGLIHDEPKSEETDVLMTVDLKVITNAECLKFDPDKNVFKGDICTDGKGPKGTCEGDSGGPLMLNGVQIGVTSGAVTEHCQRNDPSIYARVTSYLKWIDDTVKALK